MKKRSKTWKILNAAIKYLEGRKLAKDILGRDAEGDKMDEEDLFDNPNAATCVCAQGAIYGGGGTIRASFSDAEKTVNELNAFTREWSKCRYTDVTEYNDRSHTRKADVIKLLTLARDVRG